MKNKLTAFLIFASTLLSAQIKVKDLPTTAVGVNGDFLLKDDAAGIPGSTKKISISNFISTYSLSAQTLSISNDTLTITPYGNSVVLPIVPGALSGSVDSTYIPRSVGSYSLVNSYLRQIGDSIVLDSGKYIRAQGSPALLSFGSPSNYFWELSLDAPTYDKPYIYGDTTTLYVYSGTSGILYIQSDSLRFQVAGTYGNSGDLLTANGAGSASWQPPATANNFANADLTFTADRTHDADDKSLMIEDLDYFATTTDAGGAYGEAYIYMDSTILQIQANPTTQIELNTTGTAQISAGSQIALLTPGVLAIQLNGNGGGAGDVLTADGTGFCDWQPAAGGGGAVDTIIAGSGMSVANSSGSYTVSVTPPGVYTPAIASNTITIDGHNAYQELDSTSSSVTTLTVSYANIPTGATVIWNYMKTTASNCVITFPTGTLISQSCNGIVSGQTLTLVSTTSGDFLIWITRMNGGRYIVTCAQNTP